MTTYRSNDIDSVGFSRSSLVTFLALDGINLPATDSVIAPPKKTVPPWAVARRGLRRLTVSEAARVLLGEDPLYTEWRGEDEWREFEGSKRVLLQALEDHEIRAVDIDFGTSEEIFSVAELRVWATSVGYEWPIPELNPIAKAGARSADGVPVESSDLLQRLQESERERIQFQQAVEELQGKLKEAGARDGKLAEQAAFIGQLQAEIDKSKTEIARLQTEIGQGKGVSTLQKLVIGMAIGGYSYRPDAARSDIPSQIASDLAGCGITITDDTVRARLKEATNLHLQKDY